MNSFLNNRQRTPKVLFPKSLEEDIYCGKLLGYSHPQTSIYNVVCTDEFLSPSIKNLIVIGQIINIDEDEKYFSYFINLDDNARTKQIINFVNKPVTEFGQILGVRKGNEIIYYTSEELMCESEPYELINDVFSRNTGILETSSMLNKTAIISGCGSVGSLVALELARTGVGNFLLIDNDVLSYHNICRHQCGVSDVGKTKVDAIEERILQINPTARVRKSATLIEEVSKEIFDEFLNKNSIIIGCADNREGDVYANKMSKLWKTPFLSIGFWERAFVGEIFYTLPNGMPCYQCFYDEIGIVLERPVNTKFYTNEKNLEKLNFEPGISVDINYVTTIAIKLAIDILNIGSENYIPKVIDHLDQFTLVCNTNDERIGGEQTKHFSYPLQIRKGVDVSYCNKCADIKSCVLLT